MDGGFDDLLGEVGGEGEEGTPLCEFGGKDGMVGGLESSGGVSGGERVINGLFEGCQVLFEFFGFDVHGEGGWSVLSPWEDQGSVRSWRIDRQTKF